MIDIDIDRYKRVLLGICLSFIKTACKFNFHKFRRRVNYLPILFSLGLYFFSVSFLTAQIGWTLEEKNAFKDVCLKNLSDQNLKDEATLTCACVLEKLIKKYPRAVDASANGASKILKFTLGCLPLASDGKWHPLIQRQFFETCMELSNPNKSIKSPKDFCFCILGKFQVKYKQEELVNLTELDRNNQIEASATECNP